MARFTVYWTLRCGVTSVYSGDVSECIETSSAHDAFGDRQRNVVTDRRSTDRSQQSGTQYVQYKWTAATVCCTHNINVNILSPPNKPYLQHFMPSSSNTVCEGNVFGMSRPSVRSFVRSSGQNLLPRYHTNGSSNLDETYREHSLFSSPYWCPIRFLRSKVKGQGHRRSSR